MLIFLGIIVAIIMFSIIVLIHEWGHFAAARKFGVRVEEFGLGIPPRAKKLFYDKKGTLFSLNWLPIGGFVKLTGEMPTTFLVYDKNKKLYNNLDLEKDIKSGKQIYDKQAKPITKHELEQIQKALEENNADYNLANKPSWQQAIIIMAGVIMNFLLAWLIFFVLFLIGVSPIGINSKIETDLDLKLIPTYDQAIDRGLLIKNHGLVLYPVDGSIAQKSGIKEGDVLNKIISCDDNNKIINNNTCSNGEEVIYSQVNIAENLIEVVQKNKGKKIGLQINDGDYLFVEVGNDGKIGTYLGENISINEDYKIKYSILGAASNGLKETKNQILLTFKGLGVILQKIFNPETPEERQEAIQSVSGPIGIVDFLSKSITAGVTFIMVFAAIVSISLGVFNLLPIPALDGGRFVFITINGLIKKVFGKKAINEKVEGLVHFGFFVLLIALSLIIAYNDINKIIAN